MSLEQVEKCEFHPSSLDNLISNGKQ